jgi:hypothetical protein
MLSFIPAELKMKSVFNFAPTKYNEHAPDVND